MTDESSTPGNSDVNPEENKHRQEEGLQKHIAGKENASTELAGKSLPERITEPENLEPEDEGFATQARTTGGEQAQPVSDADYEDVIDKASTEQDKGGGVSKKDFWHYAGISQEEFQELLRFKANHEARSKWVIALIGIVLSGVSLAGALLGYVRAYNRFSRPKAIKPDFYPMRPVTRLAMFLGIIMIWVVLVLVAIAFYFIVSILGIHTPTDLIGYLLANLIVCSIVYGAFRRWRSGARARLVQGNKFGSAGYATQEQLTPFKTSEGFYIGNGLHYKDKGHLLTVAGTRGGKGRDVIIPNLLGAANIECSWVIIDPKAENAAITSDWQRRSGQNVVLLNPWNLLSEHVGVAESYNPLDMLSDLSSPNLVDDVAMIAEMIVPISKDDKNAFFTNGARMVVAGLLLHLVTSQPKKTRTLTTLWKWVRYIGDDWDRLLQEMVVSDDPVNGDIVVNAAFEITKLADSGAETFGSIISNVLQATDFLKSPAMQNALESGFDPQILADGRTTVYVIIPADKLRSHARWLRLTVTSMMRAVIRRPKNRVCFLLDEFAALGYLPEIETALSTYSGYNVTVWPILQSLIQLKALYNDNWESFVANSAVRQYFSIKDNFSLDYISHAAGIASHVLVSRSWFGISEAESNQRLLLTPDEIRARSGNEIFLFINELPLTTVQKIAYFIMELVKDRAKNNPYFQ